MTIEQAIHERVHQLCREKNLSPGEIGYHKIDGEETTVEALSAICYALEIRVYDFFNSDLFFNLDHA